MSDEEKKAIEKLKEYALCKVNDNGYVEVSANGYKHTILNLIEKQQKEIEHYKRLAEMNLKDSEEFKENMCEHRCILNNQIMELTEELNNLKEIEKSHQEENGKLRFEFEKVYEDNLTLANELEQEKETNKELQKYEEAYKLLSYGLNNYISKDKIKEIVDECIEKKVNVITGEEEYCFNTNDNSFLAHKIVELVEEK